MLLACLGLIGFIYSVIALLRNEVAKALVVVRAFDLVTTVRSLDFFSLNDNSFLLDCAPCAPCRLDRGNYLRCISPQEVSHFLHQPSSC